MKPKGNNQVQPFTWKRNGFLFIGFPFTEAERVTFPSGKLCNSFLAGCHLFHPLALAVLQSLQRLILLLKGSPNTSLCARSRKWTVSLLKGCGTGSGPYSCHFTEWLVWIRLRAPWGNNLICLFHYNALHRILSKSWWTWKNAFFLETNYTTPRYKAICQWTSITDTKIQPHTMLLFLILKGWCLMS